MTLYVCASCTFSSLFFILIYWFICCFAVLLSKEIEKEGIELGWWRGEGALGGILGGETYQDVVDEKKLFSIIKVNFQ